MLIQGDANGASIELSEQNGLITPDGSEFYRVTLRENDFEASIRVYAFNPTNDGLHKFFRRLADNWKGWEGERKWASLEGEFDLICEHDGVGHIGTTVTIHSDSGRNGWTGQIRFDIAAGELERIANGVNRFFDITA